jgi:hypothetical protein
MVTCGPEWAVCRVENRTFPVISRRPECLLPAIASGSAEILVSLHLQ